jgi:hypothetical protein
MTEIEKQYSDNNLVKLSLGKQLFSVHPEQILTGGYNGTA